MIGQSHPISVTNGKPYLQDHCGIWVDWNNNGSFYDENETIMISNTMTDNTYHSIITPPLGTPEGSVRMRIRINYGSNVDPCGITSWGGEVEDYTINILPPQYGSLSGYVTDPIAGPIEGARVFSGSYEAITNAAGYYQIESLYVGVYDVSCEADTYHTQVKLISKSLKIMLPLLILNLRLPKSSSLQAALRQHLNRTKPIPLI